MNKDNFKAIILIIKIFKSKNICNMNKTKLN